MWSLSSHCRYEPCSWFLLVIKVCSKLTPRKAVSPFSFSWIWVSFTVRCVWWWYWQTSPLGQVLAYKVWVLWTEYAISGKSISYQCPFCCTTQQECQENNKIISLLFVQKRMEPLSGTWGHGCSSQAWQRALLSHMCPSCISTFASVLLCGFAWQSAAHDQSLLCVTLTEMQSIGFAKDTSAQCKAPQASSDFFFFVWKQLIACEVNPSDSQEAANRLEMRPDKLWPPLPLLGTWEPWTISFMCWMLIRQQSGKDN